MANTAELYEVRITLPVNSEPFTFVFRSGLSLDQSVDLARSIWLSTDNRLIAVNVVKVDGVVPCITFRSRE